MRREDVKALLVSLLPEGSESLYALENSDNIGGILWALAGAVKDAATDRVAALRREVNPSTIFENIPAWEAALGLANTTIALFGTTEQRRNAVLAALREHGSFSLDDIRAAVQPFLRLYADPSQIDIRETDRDALRTAHSRVNVTPLVVGASSYGTSTIRVPDDPIVSHAGATATIVVTGDLSEISLRLSSPGGAKHQDFPPGFLGDGMATVEIFTLRALNVSDTLINGDWELRLTTGPGSGATVHLWNLFVEGFGVNLVGPPPHPPARNGEGLGSAMFEFLVLADPALLGVGSDIEAAYRVIQKIKPAHVIGNIGLAGALGDGCAIPDDPASIPNRCLPCS